LLFGEVGQIVQGIRQRVTKCRLSGAKRKMLCGMADYFHRHRTRMRYDESLANGWPIASGPVEGAGKNLIQDRWSVPECAGPRRWPKPSSNSEPIYLSGDFDRCWSFHIAKDQERLHPSRWSVVLK
jgi:hypothetical protein